MSLEITENFTLNYEDDRKVSEAAGVANRRRTVTTRRPAGQVQNIGTSEEAILLGDTTAPCCLYLRNLDPTNFVNVKVGTGGAIFARLDPDTLQDGTGGWCYLARVGSGAQAPFAIADTAACDIEIFTCPV